MMQKQFLKKTLGETTIHMFWMRQNLALNEWRFQLWFLPYPLPPKPLKKAIYPHSTTTDTLMDNITKNFKKCKLLFSRHIFIKPQAWMNKYQVVVSSSSLSCMFHGKRAIGDPSYFLSSFKISIKGKDCKPNLKSDGIVCGMWPKVEQVRKIR